MPACRSRPRRRRKRSTPSRAPRFARLQTPSRRTFLQVLSTTSARRRIPHGLFILRARFAPTPSPDDGATAARRKSGKPAAPWPARLPKAGEQPEASVRIGSESRDRDAVADLGVAGVAPGAAVDDGIVRAIGEQRLEHGEVEPM